MIRCVAYSEVLGRMCGQPAYIFDRDRGGWVCAEHHNDEPSEDLTEATITLKIKTQATLIEHQLALKKIFLERAGRLLPQRDYIFLPGQGRYSPYLDGVKPSIDVLPGPGTAQGERSQGQPHKLRLAGSTPAPAILPGWGNGKTEAESRNPNAAHPFRGSRW